MKNVTTKLLTAAIIVCLVISADKVYSAALKRMPLASVGECLLLNDSDMGEMKVKILENSILDATSKLEVQVDVFGRIVTLRAIGTFEEMRAMNPRKVDCK